MTIVEINNLQEFIKNIVDLHNIYIRDKQALEELRTNIRKELMILDKMDSITKEHIRLAPIFIEQIYNLYKDRQNIPNFINKFLDEARKRLESCSDLIDLSNRVEDMCREYEYEIIYRAPTKIEEGEKDYTIEKEKPSLFKIENLVKNEDNIYKEFIALNPDKFENMTVFDILTKMRHYKVPNRLLDVTSDPFVALFFACGNKKEKELYNGSKTIFIYKVKKNNIKYFDSDTITVLSVLTKLKNTEKQIISLLVKFFEKIYDLALFELIIFLYRSNNKIMDEKFIGTVVDFFIQKQYSKKDVLIKQVKDKDKEIYSIVESMLNNSIEKLQKEIKKNIDKNLISELKDKIKNFKDLFADSSDGLRDMFNKMISLFVPELNWQLKNEKPSWYGNKLKLDTFTKCYLVKPKMNNPRIIAQSGAFFIYPFEDTDIKTALFQDDPYKVYKINNLEKIKQDLEALNIKGTKYMPDDLTGYAEEIKKEYIKK